MHADPPFTLGLKITHHKELDVQAATIDHATYQTLYTRDGLAVTTAKFVVRNSRKQFLRVQLLPDSEVWSVFVAGQAVKPALVGHEDGKKQSETGPQILIKIINSVQGFPVDLIFATPVPEIGALGKIRGHLPRPDMVVTRTRWDVFLPDEVRYRSLESNMDIIATGVPLSSAEISDQVSAKSGAHQQATQPLRIDIPKSGISYTFEKLYANRSEEDAWFSLSYASGPGATFSVFLNIVGTLMVWLGLFVAYRKKPTLLKWPWALAAGGLVILVGSMAIFGSGIGLPVRLSIVLGALVAAYEIFERIQAKMKVEKAVAPPPMPPPV